MMLSNKDITWIQPYYDIILNLVPIDTKTLLDVGAGKGIFGFILKKTRNAKITAIEPFPDYSIKLHFYDYLVTKKWQDCTVKELVQKSELDVPRYNRYDCVTALEMIEHLTKPDALYFLRWAKYIGNKVIIATPYTFEQQEEYDDNPLQKHLCNVTIQDFIHRYDISYLSNFS